MALGAAFAHHAPAMYDTSRQLVMTGTVTAFEWTEPHTRVEITVVDAGGTEASWSLEGMTPAYLGRRGWSRDTLEPGDRIEVVFFPRKDGASGGMFVRATLPDGTVKVMADVSRY
jgi:hypothetical protein